MLELSTTTGYALLALGYLERCRDRWVLAREIADHTEVAAPYLSRILYTLGKHGLVIAKRGYRGGFRLARPGTQIALLDIVDAVEHRPRTSRCLLGLARCADQSACPIHLLWKTASSQVEASLSALTLDKIAEAVSQRSAHGLTARDDQAHGVGPGGKDTARRPAARRSRARANRKRPCRSRES